MRGNGALAGGTAKVARSGQMESDIRAIGRTTFQKGAGHGSDGEEGMVLRNTFAVQTPSCDAELTVQLRSIGFT